MLAEIFSRNFKHLGPILANHSVDNRVDSRAHQFVNGSKWCSLCSINIHYALFHFCEDVEEATRTHDWHRWGKNSRGRCRVCGAASMDEFYEVQTTSCARMLMKEALG
jgi:hypothetical protein